ncbi:MAG: hypothetical protein SchgKO_16040 [Schleiferiaceae bacterium]
MKNKPLPLTMPSPCQENWEDMTPEEKGRQCLKCQTKVWDFTESSPTEIEAFFKASKSKVCGRFTKDQIETPKSYLQRQRPWILAGLFAFMGHLGFGQKVPEITKTKLEIAYQERTPITMYKLDGLRNQVRFEFWRGFESENKYFERDYGTTVTIKNPDTEEVVFYQYANEDGILILELDSLPSEIIKFDVEIMGMGVKTLSTRLSIEEIKNQNVIVLLSWETVVLGYVQPKKRKWWDLPE